MSVYSVNPTRTETTRLVESSGNRRVWEQVVVITCTALAHDSISAAKNYGCTCPVSSRAAARYEKRRRCGQIKPERDATGTRLRLQALAVDGWPAPTIAERTGLHEVTISEIRRGATATVFGTTAEKVAAVYEELCGTPGPSDRTRAFAARHGWRGYDAWEDIDYGISFSPALHVTPSPTACTDDLDEVAVERAMHGDPVELTRAERDETLRRLHSRGLSYSEIGERMRRNTRWVHRHLSKLGLVCHVDESESVA